MDAVKFLKEKRRLCVNNACDEGCCPLFEYKCCCDVSTDHYEEIVDAVEKWSKEHPAKTRQSEFLKMWPDAEMVKGNPNIYPCVLDGKEFIKDGKCRETHGGCEQCRHDFWSAEIKDGEA